MVDRNEVIRLLSEVDQAWVDMRNIDTLLELRELEIDLSLPKMAQKACSLVARTIAINELCYRYEVF